MGTILWGASIDPAIMQVKISVYLSVFIQKYTHINTRTTCVHKILILFRYKRVSIYGEVENIIIKMDLRFLNIIYLNLAKLIN